MNVKMELKQDIYNKGYRYSWVAEQVGKTAQELNKWLNGVRPMPIEIKEKIEKLIGLKS